MPVFAPFQYATFRVSFHPGDQMTTERLKEIIQTRYKVKSIKKIMEHCVFQFTTEAMSNIGVDTIRNLLISKHVMKVEKQS